MNFDLIHMTGTLGAENYDVFFEVPFFNVVAFFILAYIMLEGFKLVFNLFRS